MGSSHNPPATPKKNLDKDREDSVTLTPDKNDPDDIKDEHLTHVNMVKKRQHKARRTFDTGMVCGDMEHDVFLSYTSQDSMLPYATSVVKRLKMCGIRCCMDKCCFDTTDIDLDLKQTIREFIKTSTWFVILGTNHYFTSEFCKYEYDIAIELKKPIQIICFTDHDNGFKMCSLKRHPIMFSSKVEKSLHLKLRTRLQMIVCVQFENNLWVLKLFNVKGIDLEVIQSTFGLILDEWIMDTTRSKNFNPLETPNLVREIWSIKVEYFKEVVRDDDRVYVYKAIPTVSNI